jgi:hypothetical protein
LQDNQIRWLAYCAQHGMPVRVLDVRWAEDWHDDAQMHGAAASETVATFDNGAAT